MNVNDSPFLYMGGQHTGPLSMRYSQHFDNGDNPRPFVTDFGKGGFLISMNADNANAYLISIVEALYGQDALTMETAELLVNRGNAVLVDTETIKCPTCNGYGQTGAPWDPQSCTSCRGTGMVSAADVDHDGWTAIEIDEV